MLTLKSNLKSVTENNFISQVSGFLESIPVTESQVNVDTKKSCFSISYWHTKQGYQKHGYGVETLKKNLENLVSVFGIPENFEYIWNGANQYVLDWLINNFDAKPVESLAIAKYEAGESWEGHVYVLNREKVVRFFFGEYAVF